MVFWSIVGGLFVLLMAVGWWYDRRRSGRINLRTPDAGIASGRGQGQHVATRIHSQDVGGGLGPM